MPDTSRVSTIVIKRTIFIKRTIDLVGALFGLLLCSPLMLLISLLIWAKAGRPIFYRESRIGLYQKPFRLYKFRSMKYSSGHPESSVASGDDPRILSFGHVLRQSHLDELPQLLSVLKGDMSLVGPRPYKLSHFEILPVDSRQIIASVKPGLTGSDALLFIAEDEALIGIENPEDKYFKYFLPEKIKYQVEYVKTRTTLVDLKLIFQTIFAMVSTSSRLNSRRYLQSLLSQIHK